MERYGFSSEPAAYFVTFSIVDWLPVFVAEAPCKIVTDSFNFCHESKSLRVNAYVIMPTHLHAIVFDAAWDPKRLEQTLVDMRKFTGRKLVNYLAGWSFLLPSDLQGSGGGRPPTSFLATDAPSDIDYFRAVLAAEG